MPIEIISESADLIEGEFDLENVASENIFEIISPADELSKTDK